MEEQEEAELSDSGLVTIFSSEWKLSNNGIAYQLRVYIFKTWESVQAMAGKSLAKYKATVLSPESLCSGGLRTWALQ